MGPFSTDMDERQDRYFVKSIYLKIHKIEYSSKLTDYLR